MRWAGRIVALLFLVWIVIIVLGGLGVGPAERLPLGRVLQPSSGPPPVRRIPPAARPAAADLVPALPDSALPPVGAPVTTHTRAARTTTTTTTHGRSASAPGHPTTIKAHGRSGSPPRQVTRTTTTTVATVPGNLHAHRRGKKP